MVKPNKNSNLYVGDYRMTFFLSFQNQIIANRFFKDTFQRHLLYIRIATALSAIITIANCAHIGKLPTLLLIIMHLLAYYKITLRTNRFMLRFLFILFNVAHKIIIYRAQGYQIAVCFNIMTIISDYLLTYTWYFHSLFAFIEAACFNYFTTKSCIFGFIWSTILSTFIFGCVERLLKENWVLFDSFKRSYCALQRLVDTLPIAVMIIDKKGTIEHKNTEFDSRFNYLSKGKKKPIKHKILDIILEKDKVSFNEAIIKANKGEKVNLGMYVGNTENQEFNDISMQLFQWKSFKSILCIAYNSNAQRKLVTSMIQQLNTISDQAEETLTSLENAYSADKQMQKKLFNTLEKIQRLRHIINISYFYGLNWIDCSMKPPVSYYDIKQMTRYFVELIANNAFERGISLQLILEGSFPEDVSGNLMLFRCCMISLLNMLIRICKDTTILIIARLKVFLQPANRK